MINEIRQQLEALAAEHALRQRRVVASPCGPRVDADGRSLLAFCSNDYLGLAQHPALIEAACEGAARYGVGAGASHLVSGHSLAHHTLEDALATFMDLPRALLFSSGYLANLAIIPALLSRHDAVFADKLNHACLVDAARLSGAEHHRYRHGDLAGLERALSTSRAKRKLVATDGVFSMDGDIAPLPGLLALCERFDALLLVDDAHGFGVLGDHGRGSLDHFKLQSERVLYMGTLGKAAGVSGAFVAGHATLIEWLMQRGRPYVFTTASPPLLAHTLLTALELIRKGDERRQHLHALIGQLRRGLIDTPWALMPSSTPIQPILLGSNERALAVSEALMNRGLWVPAIRPPTVPAGQARLRVSLTAAHSEADVAALIDALKALA